MLATTLLRVVFSDLGYDPSSKVIHQYLVVLAPPYKHKMDTGGGNNIGLKRVDLDVTSPHSFKNHRKKSQMSLSYLSQ